MQEVCPSWRICLSWSPHRGHITNCPPLYSFCPEWYYCVELQYDSSVDFALVIISTTVTVLLVLDLIGAWSVLPEARVMVPLQHVFLSSMVLLTHRHKLINKVAKLAWITNLIRSGIIYVCDCRTNPGINLQLTFPNLV